MTVCTFELKLLTLSSLATPYKDSRSPSPSNLRGINEKKKILHNKAELLFVTQLLQIFAENESSVQSLTNES